MEGPNNPGAPAMLEALHIGHGGATPGSSAVPIPGRDTGQPAPVMEVGSPRDQLREAHLPHSPRGEAPLRARRTEPPPLGVPSGEWGSCRASARAGGGGGALYCRSKPVDSEVVAHRTAAAAVLARVGQHDGGWCTICLRVLAPALTNYDPCWRNAGEDLTSSDPGDAVLEKELGTELQEDPLEEAGHTGVPCSLLPHGHAHRLPRRMEHPRLSPDHTAGGASVRASCGAGWAAFDCQRLLSLGGGTVCCCPSC